MKFSVVYNTITGNTEKLAEVVKNNLEGCEYYGGPDDKALDSDTIFIGFWTAKYDSNPEIIKFIEKVKDKKVFLFGTAGYNNTKEFFDDILKKAESHLDSSNKIIGSYMCQGRVSDAKRKALESTLDEEKYKAMLPKIEEGDGHPDKEDLDKFLEVIKSVQG